MTIFTELLTGDATGYEVYGGLTGVNHYLFASGSAEAAAFRALVADDQRRKLIDATRYIDEQFWQGAPTGLAGGTPTTLSFPRTGLTAIDGTPLDATNVPIQVVTAAFWLAAILSVDPDVASSVDSGSNVKSLGAGPARIEFFRPTSVRDGNATALPTVVDRLIGRWLAAVAAFTGGVATGVNPISNFRAGRSGFGCSICGSTTTCACGEQRTDLRRPL